MSDPATYLETPAAVNNAAVNAAITKNAAASLASLGAGAAGAALLAATTHSGVGSTRKLMGVDSNDYVSFSGVEGFVNNGDKVRIESTRYICGTGTRLAFVDGAWYNAEDTAIQRSSAGVLEINSGSAGVYRDLQLRNLTASGTVALGESTVGTLPAPTLSTRKRIEVTDALAPAVGVTVMAGGASKATVRSNGTNWVVIELL